eukprot:1908340-Pyramimonas_sp.AAC.1
MEAFASFTRLEANASAFWAGSFLRSVGSGAVGCSCWPPFLAARPFLPFLPPFLFFLRLVLSSTSTFLSRAN